MGKGVEVNHNKFLIFCGLSQQAFIRLGSAVWTLGQGVDFFGGLAIRAPASLTSVFFVGFGYILWFAMVFLFLTLIS